MAEAPIKFGTDGWRAVMCDTFTFANVRMVCQALAEHLLETQAASKGVAIGFDARFLSDRFAREAAAVFVGNGIPVYLAQTDLPTPVVAFGVVAQKLAGAVMFTASHNPPEYNGIKFIPEFGGPADPATTTAIERHLRRVLADPQSVQTRSIPEAEAAGLIRAFDPLPAYTVHLRTLVDFPLIARSRLRIAFDPMHGSGRAVLGPLLREAGVHVLELRGTRDPLFGGATPEPTAANLMSLAQTVTAESCHLGLATDGDADRFGAVDEDGSYLSPNQVITLLLAHLVESRGYRHAVVRTVATTHLLDRLAKHYGIPAYETPVGFKFICERMRSEPVVIGGEESGGLSVFGHIPEKDGILANLLLAEMRAVRGMALGRVLAELAATVGGCENRRIDLHMSSGRKQGLMKALRESTPDRVGQWPVERVNQTDGVKLELAGGRWLLVRPSGTEDLVRLYLEAPDAADLAELTDAATALIERMGA